MKEKYIVNFLVHHAILNFSFLVVFWIKAMFIRIYPLSDISKSIWKDSFYHSFKPVWNLKSHRH